MDTEDIVNILKEIRDNLSRISATTEGEQRIMEAILQALSKVEGSP